MTEYKVMAYTTKRGYVGITMMRSYNVNATCEEHAKNIVRKIARNRGYNIIINEVKKV